ncbi:MAG: SufE family protein [Candidatus Kapabacteria bacterium]|nr:SufE family protein [Candidatus Kapabacteria bacterium]
MVNNVAELIDLFAMVDNEMRLNLLLDFSAKQPDLNGQHTAARDTGLYNIPECQTPVYLHLARNGDTLQIIWWVAEESPTVRGFVTALCLALDGKPLTDAATLPNDMLQQMGLIQALSSLRSRGLDGIVRRIKRIATELGGA